MIVNIEKSDVVVTGLYQYDYGQSLDFSGCQVADRTEVHFFQGEYGCRTETKNNSASIPDYLLMSSRMILAYLYIADEKKGKTIKRLTILVLPRDRPPDYIDPSKPEDYSRLLPVGGEVGDSLYRTADGYEWKKNDEVYVTDEELQKVTESLPVAMTVQEVFEICKI